MFEKIFYDVIVNLREDEILDFFKDQKKIYDLFCKNGYIGDFAIFKLEMKEFLQSDQGIRLLSNDDEVKLPDEMIEMVAGGSKNLADRCNTIMSLLNELFRWLY